MLVQGCLGLGICKDTGIPEQRALAAELGMEVYIAGTLMFPDEQGKQDDRAVRIAKTYGVWVALATFAGPTVAATPCREAVRGSGVLTAWCRYSRSCGGARSRSRS
jgi:hypothetical protein